MREAVKITIDTINKLCKNHLEAIETLERLRYTLITEEQKQLKGGGTKIAFSGLEQRQFKKQFDLALKDGVEKFEFKSREYYTEYAKYVVKFYSDKGK